MGVLCLAINQTIWGAPETWVDGSTAEQKANIKFAVSSQDTYRELYTQGILELNTIDLSAAFWGIGKGSIFNMPHYLSPYQLDDETEVAIDAAADNIDRPLILSSSVFAGDQYIRYASRYAPHRTDPVVTTTMSYTGKIILDYNYKNLFVVPWVSCKATGYTSSISSYTLYEYIETAKYETLPEVIGIQFAAYFGDGSVSRSSGGIGIISDCNFPGSDLYYGSNTFWTQFGCSILYNTTESSTSARSIIGCLHNSTTTINNTVGDAITALAYKYSKTESTSVPVYYFDPDNDIWTVNKTAVRSGNTVWYEYPYINVTSADIATRLKEYVLSQIAYLGFPFVYDPALVSQGQIGDLGVYLPKFDANGVTTGEYEEGDAALRLPNADWTDGRTGSGYDPTRKPGEDDFGDLTNRRPTRVQTGSVNYYVTNYETIYTLQRFLNAQYVPSGADLTADFKGTNPADYIVSIQKYPVALPTAGSSLVPDEDVYIGKINTAIKAFRLPASLQGGTDKYLDFGTTDISPYFSTTIDFRDYLSKILLFMPFVGTAELDPKIFIGHTLGLIYNIDYLTGSVAAEIKRDGLTIETRTAKLAQTVPFFAGNMGQYQNEIAQTGFAIEQSKIKQITGAVTTLLSIGGAAATVAGGGSELAGLGSGAGLIRGASNMLLERINQESLEYRLEHTQPQIGTISTASAGNAFLLDDRARVLIWRPYMLPGYDQATYSHVVGHATLRAAALSEFSGLTVAAAAELSNIYTLDGTKSASEQELKLIKQALLAGVYI